MADSDVKDTADLSAEGADALIAFIQKFYAGLGKDQPFLRIILDDGTEIDKAELVLVTDDDDPIYELRLSGI